jgi:hypothetical protein
MTYSLVETTSGSVVVTMNEKLLLKFIGWCEAHRTDGGWEPAFVTECLGDLNCAHAGSKLGAEITVVCALCDAGYEIDSPGIAYDWGAGEWFCTSEGDAECNQRHIDEMNAAWHATPAVTA